jgi:hypothetical protein
LQPGSVIIGTSQRGLTSIDSSAAASLLAHLYSNTYPKEYRERVETFSRNFIWRKITGDITIEFLEAAVERMFTADEVSSVVDLAKLKELRHRIVHLFLYANDTGRNHYGSSDTL